jgi:hypothetical protein
MAMGMGAMAVVMLRLPMTSILLATILLGSDGVSAMPLVIVAVVVAFVGVNRLAPIPSSSAADDKAKKEVTAPAQAEPVAQN